MAGFNADPAQRASFIAIDKWKHIGHRIWVRENEVLAHQR
jgi:hypothetical protein